MENNTGIISTNDENQVILADGLEQLQLRGKICMSFSISVFIIIIQGMHNYFKNA